MMVYDAEFKTSMSGGILTHTHTFSVPTRTASGRYVKSTGLVQPYPFAEFSPVSFS
jgi:hypothetical protein